MTRYGKVPSSSQIQGQVPNVLPSLIATGSPCGPSQERSGAVSGMNEEIITHTEKVVANVRPSFQRDPSVTTLYSPPCSPCSWPPGQFEIHSSDLLLGVNTLALARSCMDESRSAH